MKKLTILISVILLFAFVGTAGAKRGADKLIVKESSRTHSAIPGGGFFYLDTSSQLWFMDKDGNATLVLTGGTTTFAIPHHILTALDNQTGVSVETTAENGDIAIALIAPNSTWKIEDAGSDGGDLFFYKIVGATRTEALELTENSADVPGTFTAGGNITTNEDLLIVPTETAVDIDVTTSGAYHATAETIFKVDLTTAYTGKTLTFTTEVAGTTVWVVDAVSIGRYGGASGVTVENNVDTDFLISIYFASATCGFVMGQTGTASYTPIP